MGPVTVSVLEDVQHRGGHRTINLRKPPPLISLPLYFPFPVSASPFPPFSVSAGAELGPMLRRIYKK